MKSIIVVLSLLCVACASHPCKPTFPIPPAALMVPPAPLVTIPDQGMTGHDVAKPN